MSHNIWHSSKTLNHAAGKSSVAGILQACQTLQTITSSQQQGLKQHSRELCSASLRAREKVCQVAGNEHSARPVDPRSNLAEC